uniref:Uncharacterized protein n=1 Tax=Glossina pallidipes TaxID=7398 RepID=A0A1B0AG29_GLOPL
MLNANGHYQCDHSRNFVIRAVGKYYLNALTVLKIYANGIKNLLPLDNPMVQRCEHTFYDDVSRRLTRMNLTAPLQTADLMKSIRNAVKEWLLLSASTDILRKNTIFTADMCAELPGAATGTLKKTGASIMSFIVFTKKLVPKVIVVQAMKYALGSESMSYKLLISYMTNNELIFHSSPISIALNETKQLQEE